MELDDFVEAEVGIAVAATAILASPKARGYLRRGLVYGVAAVLATGDALKSTAQKVASSASSVAESARQATAALKSSVDGEPTEAVAKKKTRPASA